MSDTSPADTDLQTVLDALADPDCREILDELSEPRSASEVADRCDLSQTSTYRKLQALCDADLCTEGTQMRPDGHHVTTYERDVSGVAVLVESDGGFDFEFVHESRTPDQRLAEFWSAISEEL